MIEIVEYDPAWPRWFEHLRERYVRALAGVSWVAIEHVGSTAVEGLAAKPIIDIVVTAEHVADASAALEHIGYVALGEMGIPDRWAFREPPGAHRTNTYIVVQGSLALRNHLGVRDVLRANHSLRDEYATVKQRLAASIVDRGLCVEGKSALLRKVLERVGLAEDERAAIEEINRARPAEQL